MTWLGWSFLVVMLWPALYITWDLHRMRKAAERMLLEMQERERLSITRERLSIARESEIAQALEEAAMFREVARQFYREATSRWSRLVLTERRVH